MSSRKRNAELDEKIRTPQSVSYGSPDMKRLRLDEDAPDELDDSLSGLRRRNRPAYDTLQMTRTEIMNDEPSLEKLLSQQLFMKDRAHLFQMYEIYRSLTPNTEDWLRFRDLYIKTLKDATVSFSDHSRLPAEQHEQLTILQSSDGDIQELSNYKYRILQLETSMVNKQAIFHKYIELTRMERGAEEFAKCKTWLDHALAMPYDRVKRLDNSVNIKAFLQNIARRLDEELYGMEAVKEQILVFINSKLLNPNMKKCSLALIGPPGVGKTRISRLLAELLDFPFQQIACGGISDASFFKGHQQVYVGSEPGEISKCMQRMQYKNGILFLDEFEKISDNKEICSALLHITDPAQNSEFHDSYLSGLSIDLSHLWFVYAMNSYPVDSALRDRIFAINVPGYDIDDKLIILTRYLLPGALRNVGIAPDSITITEDAGRWLIEKIYTNEENVEGGVRKIERVATELANKLLFQLTHQDERGSTGFNMSFCFKRPLIAPVSLTKELLSMMFPEFFEKRRKKASYLA